MYLSVAAFCIDFFFKQKTAYEMRISDWRSYVCSSDLSIMHLLIDQRIEALTHIRSEFIMDCSDQIGFHPQHRLGRHPLDYADAGDNDAPRAQLVEQSIEQNTPVHDGHGFDFQPGH